MTDKFILAIETSIKSGSLSISNCAGVIESWAGNNDISRSEDLIPQISRLLEKNQLRLDGLQKIAVSTGPGSFTGIRVGIAVAKGLAFALDRPLTGVSIFEALALADSLFQAEIKAAIVSAGRDLYFWQIFQGMNPLNTAATGNSAQLESELGKYKALRVIAEPIAFKSLSENNFGFLTETQIINDNCAELIGRCAANQCEEPEDVSPLYVRPAVMLR